MPDDALAAEPERSPRLPTLVVHIGPSTAGVGGMETVIRTYLHLAQPWTVRAVGTWSEGRAKPLAIARHAAWMLAQPLLQARSSLVIHVHLSHLGAFMREGMFVILARYLGLRCVVTIHGSHFVETSGHWLWKRVYKLVLCSATRVAVLNARALEAASSMAKPGRVQMLLNPGPANISDVSLPTANRIPRVVFGGSVGERKGVDILLDAWEHVTAARPEAQLELWGPIDARASAELRSKIQPYYKGTAAPSQLLTILRESRAAALPSRQEAMPMFVLEAMAMATPLVVSDAGAMSWQVGQGGLVVPRNSPDQLASALVAILADDLLANRLGLAANDRYHELFGAETVVRALENFYAYRSEDAKQ